MGFKGSRVNVQNKTTFSCSRIKRKKKKVATLLKVTSMSEGFQCDFNGSNGYFQGGAMVPLFCATSFEIIEAISQSYVLIWKLFSIK